MPCGCTVMGWVCPSHVCRECPHVCVNLRGGRRGHGTVSFERSVAVGMGRCLNRKILSVSSIPGYRKIAPVSTITDKLRTFWCRSVQACKCASPSDFLPHATHITPASSFESTCMERCAWRGVWQRSVAGAAWSGRSAGVCGPARVTDRPLLVLADVPTDLFIHLFIYSHAARGARFTSVLLLAVACSSAAGVHTGEGAHGTGCRHAVMYPL